MKTAALDIVCPACRAELRQISSHELRCSGCAARYPLVLGIPDLRLWPDPYVSLAEDRAKACKLAELCAELDFAQSVELYYRITDAVPPFQARRFARSLHAAAGRSAALLDDFEASGVRYSGRTLLDLGCGTAPLLASAAARCDRVAGVDVALRWLIMARKRLEETQAQALLVCACAEALPFRDAVFDRVMGESTIEHLRDQHSALTECARVLTPGGELFLSTPNRRSLGPDPHTGLPAGSWLPNTMTAAYVRRKGGIPPRRSLLTAGTLRDRLERAGFSDVEVEPPGISRAQQVALGGAARAAVAVYNAVRSAPGGHAVLRAVGPLLHARGRKRVACATARTRSDAPQVPT